MLTKIFLNFQRFSNVNNFQAQGIPANPQKRIQLFSVGNFEIFPFFVRKFSPDPSRIRIRKTGAYHRTVHLEKPVIWIPILFRYQ